MCNFLATLARMNVLPEGIDEIVWPYNPKGSFTIKCFWQRPYLMVGNWELS